MIKVPIKIRKKEIQGEVRIEVRDYDVGSVEDDLMGWVMVKWK